MELTQPVKFNSYKKKCLKFERFEIKDIIISAFYKKNLII